MEIRQATEKDLYAIAEIGLKNWKEAYKNLLPDSFLNGLTLEARMEYYRTYLNDGLLVAVEEENVLGFAVYKPDEEIEKCTYLDSLHTGIDARGRGVGTGLINAVKQIAKENGNDKMSVSIVIGNENAERLYKKLGAEHFEYFEDNEFFEGVCVHSEKLIWKLEKE